MKTTDVLLYGLIAFGAYELFLKPGATTQNVVHPITPGLPVAASAPTTASALSNLATGLAKLLGGSSAAATGIVFTPIDVTPVIDSAQLIDNSGANTFDPNAGGTSYDYVLPTTLPLTDLSLA